MNILITAPSLNTKKNVSGISTVANTIIQYNKQHQYFHFLLGRMDQPIGKFKLVIQLVKKLVSFPFVLKVNKIDLVHQNLPFDPKGVSREYFINLWCRLFRIPVVLHVHGGIFLMNRTKNLFFKMLSQSLLQHSKIVIVLSEIEKEILKEYYQYSNAKVLSNSLDYSIFNLKKSKILNNLPVILYLGRIEKNKGIIELIEALKLLKNDLSFRFILCGAGPLTDYCIKECNTLLKSNFEYKGVVSGEKKNEIIKQSDLFVLPSYFEGLPMSLLETMAAGVVPVVTKVGSMKIIIKQNYNGLFVNVQNAQDLFQKLRKVLLDTELYQILSKNASKTIAEQYDIKNYIVRLNEIYQSALKQ